MIDGLIKASRFFQPSAVISNWLISDQLDKALFKHSTESQLITLQRTNNNTDLKREQNAKGMKIVVLSLLLLLDLSKQLHFNNVRGKIGLGYFIRNGIVVARCNEQLDTPI